MPIATDTESPYDIPFIIKTSIITFLLFIESYFLVKEILYYINKGDFFKLDITLIAIIVALMTAIALTFSLSIGAWNNWRQYLLVPGPLAFGVFTATVHLQPRQYIIATFAFFLMCVAFVLPATATKDNLIKFDPILIFSRSVRGLLFAYSILAGGLLFLNTSQGEDFDLISKIGNFAGEQIFNIVKPELTANPITGKLEEIFAGIYGNKQGLNKENIAQETTTILEGFGITQTDETIQDAVVQQVNKLIQPYKNFILPLMALLVFGLVEFAGVFARFFFMALVRPAFVLARATSFIKVENNMVKQEQLKF